MERLRGPCTLVLLGALVQLAILWFSPLELQRASASSGPLPVRSPVVATIEMQVGDVNASSQSEVLLVGLARGPERGSPAVELVWGKKETGWLTVWEVRLRVAGELLTDGGSAILRPTVNRTGADGPKMGHTYRSALSYDPITGSVSASISDLTTGERIYAAGGQIQPSSETLYVMDDGAAISETSKQADIVTIHSVEVGNLFVPLGVDWKLRDRNERTDSWDVPLALTGKAVPLDRTSRSEIGVRLRLPHDGIPGRFLFWVDHGMERRMLHSVPVEHGEQLVILRSDDLPAGWSMLVLAYQEPSGSIWEIDGQALQVGRVNVAIGPLQPGPDEWTGTMTIAPDGPLPKIDVVVTAVAAPLFWSDGAFVEGEPEPLTLIFEEPLSLDSTQPIELRYRIPLPPSRHPRWRVQFQPVATGEIPVVAQGGFQELNNLGVFDALYVAPNGDDSWSGTLAEPNASGTDGPFVTLERARSELRLVHKDAIPAGGITVYVREGVYPLKESFEIGLEDSGRADAPIVYRAYEDETVVITGGRQVTGFLPYKGEILKANLAQQGLQGIYFRQLFVNDRRAHLARYPNFDPANPYGGGWAYADGKPIPMGQDIPGEPHDRFQYKVSDSRVWAKPEEGEVFVFPRYNWWNNIVGIHRVDSENRVIYLRGGASFSIRPGDRYFVKNLFEELDAPGEWYLDREDWTLYLWPPEGVDPEAMRVYAPVLRTLLKIGPGTQHVQFRGFTFEASEGTAIVLQETHHVTIAGNTIRNVGDYDGRGVEVEGGTNNRILGNDIHDIGSHGISISGGDRIRLIPAGNVAENNYIHHVGVYHKHGVGVALNGVGNRVAHNLIHDTPRMGIMFSGNNLVIEYNHIRHTNLETADTGALYTGGRNWISSRGTVIRYNFIHDTLGYGDEDGQWVSPHYAWGIYLDDNAGGVDIIGNIVVRALRGLVHLHNGRDNLIENNILVDGDWQQLEYTGWWESHSGWLRHLPGMIENYEAVKDQEAWQGMRNMDTHPSEAILPGGLIMSGNVFRHNIVYDPDQDARLFHLKNASFDFNEWYENLYWVGGTDPVLKIHFRGAPGNQELAWNAWQELGMDAGSKVADPLFVDAGRDDYRLRPESPAFSIGFQPIPVETIGPYEDELRATWPIVEAEGARERPAD